MLELLTREIFLNCSYFFLPNSASYKVCLYKKVHDFLGSFDGIAVTESTRSISNSMELFMFVLHVVP